MLSMDFVMELPLSFGHDTVMTVVDSVSKWAHFISTHTMVTAEGAARLFLHQVWKLYGLPKYVISDRSVMLQANFPWKITFDILYTNGFSIRICSRTLSISSECNTI